MFINEKGELKEIMKEVAKINVMGTKVICIGLLGDMKEIEDAQIIEANLMEHRIVLGKI